jgi:hypothetical protein
LYVHRKFGSWLAPGTLGDGRAVLKEVVSMDVKEALQKQALAIEKAERPRKEVTTDGPETGAESNAGSDVSTGAGEASP